jgi:hypothetical protein
MLEVSPHSIRTIYSLAMQSSRIPLIQELKLSNSGTDSIHELVMELQIWPDLGDPLRVELGTLEAGKTISAMQGEVIDTNPDAQQRAVEHRSLAFPLSTYHVQRVVEDEAVELHCRIRSGNEVLKEFTHPFKLLAYNAYRFPLKDNLGSLILNDPDWVDRAEAYACFVTPNHPLIAEVITEVSKCLGSRGKDFGLPANDNSIDGYQSQRHLPDPTKVIAMVHALYVTLGMLGVHYNNPPAGGWTSGTGQRIRFPDQVLTDSKGTCADLAPLAAACLEHMGLHPVLVLVNRHVVQGAFLNEEVASNFGSTVVDVHVVRQLIDSKRLILFDSSTYVSNPQPPFREACNEAIHHLDGFSILISIAGARKSGFNPMSVRAIPSAVDPEEISTLAKELLDRMARRIAELTASNDREQRNDGIKQPIDKVVQQRFSNWKEQLLDLSTSSRLLCLEKRSFPEVFSRVVSSICTELLTEFISQIDPNDKDESPESLQNHLLGVVDRLRSSTNALIRDDFLLIHQFRLPFYYTHGLRGFLADQFIDVIDKQIEQNPDYKTRISAAVKGLFDKGSQDLLYLEIPDDLLGQFENLISLRREFLVSGIAGMAGGLSVEAIAEELVAGRCRVMPALGLPTDDPHWHYEAGRRLARDARRAEADSGFSPLYLGLGLLQWRENPTLKRNRQNTTILQPPLLAPLVLYPIELRIDSRQKRLTLVRTEGAPIGNAALVERLRREFDIDLSILNDLPEDEHGIDLETVLVQVARAIEGQPGWHVIRTGVVGPFNFKKFLLWRDLHDNESRLLESAAVRQIASAGRDRLDDPVKDPAQLDLDQITAKDLPLVLPGDSTQIAAIQSALKGRSFVLQGPPGTGKSQTITNLIASAMAAGKTVLFVAQKKEAIDVVWKRLHATGLARYCLALDANASDSQQVANSLAEALDHRHRRPSQWEEHFQDLKPLHLHLLNYKNALHKTRAIGHSLYEMLDACLQSSTFIELPKDLKLDTLSAEQFLRNQRQLKEFIQQRDLQDDLDANPWHFARLESCGVGLEKQLQKLLIKSEQAVQGLKDEMLALHSYGLQLPEPNWELAESLSTILQRHPENRVPQVVSELQRWHPFRQQAEIWLQGEVEDKTIRQRLQLTWHDDLLTKDVSHMIQRLEHILHSFIVLRWIQAFFFRRQINSHLHQRDRSLRQILEDLRSIQLLQSERQARTQVKNQLQEELESWDGNPTTLATVLKSWSGLASLAENEPRYQPILRQLTNVPAEACTQLLGVIRNARASLTELADLLKSSLLPLDEHSKVPLDDLVDWLQSLRDNLQRLPIWSNWVRQESDFRSTDLAPLLDWAEHNNVPFAELESTYRLGVLQHWFQRCFDDEAKQHDFDLTAFSSDQHEAVQQKYRERQKALYKLNQELIQSLVSESIPHGDYNLVGSELTILSVERNKQKRWLPLRSFLQKIPTLLPKLKPCVLASPSALARFLPADGPRFDIAIFDEASQLETYQAIGAMGRSKQVIIVGDEKQMPPPKSDGTSAVDEDAVFIPSQPAQLESILSESIAYGLPQQMLRWHYRSCHESLIEFSNRKYYGNRLYLFPAAQRVSPTTGLHWHPVPDGRSRKEPGFKDSVNRREAEAVCAFLVQQLKHFNINNKNHPSFGVITFNNNQRDLIIQLMGEARRQDSELNNWFRTDKPKLADRVCFIENLETIQGDERDIILLTVGYGKKDNQGYPGNYGLIHREGGERRLNVAITRARQAVHVFSSLEPQGMRESGIGANYDGVRHLQDYLEFCKDYDAKSQRARCSNDFEGELQRQIYQVLIEAGYRVDCKIGSVGYRIDMAVIDPDEPTNYLIGIETDGLGYASAATVRDRELARHQALTLLGWKLHRVWSVGWLRNTDREKQRLLDAVQKALDAPRHRPASLVSSNPVLPTAGSTVGSLPTLVPSGGAPAGVIANSVSTSKPPTRASDLSLTARHLGRPYESATLEPASEDFSSFYREQAADLITARLQALIDVEAPITLADATRRVAACWGGKNLTKRAQNRLLECIRPLQQAQKLFIDSDDILWLSQAQRDQWQGFRRPPQAGRSLDSVAPVEIRGALVSITRAALSIDVDSLLREASKSLTGAPNFTEQRRRVLEEQLNQLLGSSLLEARDGRIFAIEVS